MALSLSPKKLGLILFKGSKMKNKLSKPKKTTKDKEAEFVTMTVKIQGITPLLVHYFKPGVFIGDKFR